MQPMEAKCVHVSIDRPWAEVYDFAHRPECMARWASGLGAGLTQEGEDWLADGGPLGQVRVTFTPRNAFGVMDHTVHMPSGLKVHNAFRIVQNGRGAEAIFLVTRLPDQTAEQFAKDAAHVAKDLARLKEIMEEEGAEAQD
ncbi:SRPBCC family protein [Rhizobium sp. SSA_523]|uniref:SRPBCC family protein n=1 Tax=Rhizobium sp. SSA_523 TaxID=2952477 RepID=UPI0020906C03|nr:SRPBCC family protein [Rhizobium sp. SSA_523]MCO5730189.1 SRPBCC family protein [Rhizobium sp. SSA_523]WKC25926.1 SRPBCC family protein [Rhizobium sp. SSA_523]